MKETLTIRNFGPIKDVTLDLRKINVFIGDQGTGKSTVAKITYTIKSFFEYNISFVGDLLDSQDEVTKQFYLHLNNADALNYINKSTFFEYNNSYSNCKLLFKNKACITTNYNPKTYHRGEQNYIVADRTMISTLSKSLYGIIDSGAKLPSLFNRFGNKYSNAKKDEYNDYSKIIGVNFKSKNGEDFIILSNQELKPMTDASTGVQRAIPLLVVFDSIVNSIIKTGLNRSQSQSETEFLLVIEEPELNLFPETQKKVLEYIVGNNFEVPTVVKPSKVNSDDVDVFESKVFKNQLIITTHSPYTLTTLNNLMYAYKVGQQHKDEVNKIIEEKYWVNPEDVRCYLMENGEAKLIMDEETKLIDTVKIDGVSDILSDEFNRIMEIALEDELS